MKKRTYEDLAFHIVDAHSLRWFCRIGFTEEGFVKSALNRNSKAISDQTWEMVNRDILGYAKQAKTEKGRTVRTDCTCGESNIHKPRDSNQLWACVRVLTRLIGRRRDDFRLKAPCVSTVGWTSKRYESMYVSRNSMKSNN